MSSDLLRINTEMLKENQSIFKQSANNFNNRAYSTFKSSYLNNSSDSYVRQMSRELNTLYNKISKGYTLINKWWSDYNQEITTNEKLLNIKCASTIDPDKAKITASFSSVINRGDFSSSKTTVSSSFVSMANIVNEVAIDSQVGIDEIDPKELARMASARVLATNSLLLEIINNNKSLGEEVLDAFKKTAATYATFSVSVFEGLGKFFEGLVDLGRMATTAFATPKLLLGDLIGGTISLASGKEWKSRTKMAWQDTMGFVAKDHVGNFFDNLYENNPVFKTLKANTPGFKYVRGAGCIIGEWVPDIALTVLSGGSYSGVIAAKKGVTLSTKAPKVLKGLKTLGSKAIKGYEYLNNIPDKIFLTGAKKIGTLGNKLSSNILKNISFPKIFSNINVRSQKGFLRIPFTKSQLKKNIKNANTVHKQEAEAINDWIKNKEYYLKQGETLKKYLKNRNISVVQLKNKDDVINYFGDSKLYLLQKLKQLESSSNLPNTDRQILSHLRTKYENVSISDLDVPEMMNNLSKYLTKSELNKALDLANNGLCEKMASSYSYKQKAAIHNYTAMGGFEINGWLNNASRGSRRFRDMYKDINDIQDRISGAHVKNLRFNKDLPSSEGSILDYLDSVISSANYDKPIETYRGLKSLYSNGIKIDPAKLKPGDVIEAGPGYSSSSVIPENSYSHSSNKTGYDIVLKTIVPPNSGTGVYIENISGISNYGQTEMLLKRNPKFIITDAPYIENINGTLKTVLECVIQ